MIEPGNMIEQWLQSLGLAQHAAAFKAAAIDLDILTDLTEADLQGLGLPLGDRKRIVRAASALRRQVPEPPAAVGPSAALRRHLTVLFCDLVASSALSASLDPEDFTEALNKVLAESRSAVEEHGGSIGRYVGDGVLAWFGYPQAHENDAERAVRAGLDLVARIGVLRMPGGHLAQVRVGIASGLVVVEDLARDGQVLGDAPNLASRLQALAKPNTVIVSDATHRLLGTLFNCVDLGPHELKGLQPQTVWQVLTHRNVVSRFEATRSTRLSALVGRQEEVSALAALWQRTKEGSGCAALLCGEAGIGKSRISAAAIEMVSGEPHTILRYQCSPHHTNTPFHPVVSQLTHAAGIEESQTADTRLDRLETLLSLGNVSPEDLPLFADLLSIPSGGRYPPEELTPQRRKERTITALMAQLTALSRAAPVLCLFEDLHWIDASTLEALNRTIVTIKAARVLVIATFRPEFFPPWLDQSHVRMMRLTRLTREHTAALLADITRGKALPPELYDQIQSKTDGVPLFVEELTKAVLESGLLEDTGEEYISLAPLQSLAIPATLQDSLTARLDRLAPVREIAQIGAVLGREFPYRLIAAIADMPEHQLRAGLSQLTAAELMFGHGEPPESTYSFKHALVQDAAYDSLLRSRRLVLHARVAAVLSETFPEVAETQPELIAYHLARAGMVEPAIDQMLRAGRRAIERSANAEAIGQLRQALGLLETVPEGPERAARALTLEVTLSQAMIASMGYAAAATKEVLLRARTHINDSTQPDLKFAVLYGLWACYYVGSDVAMQREAAADFLQQAERHGDPGVLCVANRILGTTLMAMGEFSIARMHLQRARELYDPDSHAVLRYRYGQDIGAAALCYLSWALWHVGQLDEGLKVAREAVELATALKHPHTIVYTICHASGLIDMFRSEAGETRSRTAAVIALCNEHGFPFWGSGGRILDGWAAIRTGQEDEGIELLRAGLTGWRQTGARLWLTLFLAHEADAHAAAGRAVAARQTIADALATAEETGETWAVPEALRINAGIELRLGREDGGDAEQETEALLQQSIAAARAKQARWWELCAARDLAAFWSTRGKAAEARDLLAGALRRFPTVDPVPADLRPALALLERITVSLAGGPQAMEA
jgi:class 3 adenylate cyclase/predicted ATPase